jgi:uncharacterized protein
MSELNEIIIDRKVPSTMSDGTVLYSDVYRPKEPGRYPVIVERVAYELDHRLEPYAEWYAQRGYVFVGQNSRGTFWSEGEFRPFVDEGWGEIKDGYDTIEWAASQPWSNGNVATMDGSWSGLTQNLLAPTRPPHLKTMFLRMAAASQTASNGIPVIVIPRQFMPNQLLEQARHESANEELRSHIPGLQAMVDGGLSALSELPASKKTYIDEHFPGLGLAIGNSPANPKFEATDATLKVSDIDVPILHLGGWYDMLLHDTLAMFTGVRERGFSEATRESQRLIIGPWVHGPMEPDESLQGDFDFGSEAALGINEFRKRWFDHYLNDEQNGANGMPRVRLFVMGPNKWRDFDAWPPEGAIETKMYLGENSVSLDAPTDESSGTSFDYDPSEPVPGLMGGKLGSRHVGPIDMREVEDRKTIFTSEPFDQSITVIGPVSFNLWASSNAKDTDWYVTFTDVHPDGSSIRVCEGSLRARYRNGFDREDFMEPGKPYEFVIDMKATAIEIPKGHRIRVAITSSQFPASERNMNTGGVNENEATGVVAHNTILHEREHPSHLVLPVMPT